MQIRVATAADAAQIARVHVAAWRAAYHGIIPDEIIASHNGTNRTERWQAILAQPIGATFVAEENVMVVGFCHHIPSRDPDADPKTTGEIASIYVHPEHWRAGAGRQLCLHTFQETRRRNFTNLTLWVMKANFPAIEFYGAMGFALDGAVKVERIKGFELHEIRLRLKL